jgi:hypothetical protein
VVGVFREPAPAYKVGERKCCVYCGRDCDVRCDGPIPGGCNCPVDCKVELKQFQQGRVVS